MISVWPMRGWPRIEVLGVYATLQTLAAQLVAWACLSPVSSTTVAPPRSSRRMHHSREGDPVPGGDTYQIGPRRPRHWRSR